MIHFLKYNIIGLVNTLITVAVVGVLHQILDFPVVPSNFIGYIVGAVHSYVLNRIWNFRSRNPHGPEIARFLLVFILSYLVNLGVLLGVEAWMTRVSWMVGFREWSGRWIKPGYLAHLVANAVYVVVSFGLYKKWVFAGKSEGKV